MSFEGQLIGRYRLIRLLGSGGMGEVYLAEDASIQRHIAIKIIRSEISSYPNDSTSEDLKRLFQREAKAIATMDHPNILPLYDYGEATLNGTTIAYLVMPYRPEGSFAQWLSQRSSSAAPTRPPLSTQDIVHFVRQAAGALQHAHDRRIIHQDVKPANFLIRNNQENPNRPDLLLADFGIARFTTTTIQASQNIRGTLTYMAPEQLEGLAVPASDQYALAIMAYELLAGRQPFQSGPGQGMYQLMYQHVHVQPVPPSTYNKSLPAEADTVILRALAKKPEERFHSISAFAHAFEMAMRNIDIPVSIAGKDMEATQEIRAALAISEVEAQRGTRRDLTLPDGRSVSIEVPAGARDGQLIRLEGQGLASDTGRTSALLIMLTIVSTATPPVASNQHSTMITPSMTHPPIASREAARPTSYNKPEESSRGPSRRLITLLVALVLVVVVGSAGFAFYAIMASKQAPSTNLTSTATAHTQAGSNTPGTSTTLDPYIHTGTLALNDPLQDNSQNVDWMTGQNQNNASCAFVGGAYQSSQPLNENFHACFALASDYSNFVFEVQMTIVSGQAGGIIFRGNQANSTFYYFRIGQDGSYTLRDYIDPQIDHSHLLLSGSSPAIHTGYNQPNIIAVAANGSTLNLYVNHQLIASTSDSTLSHGQIGVVAYNQGSPATVVYNNAKVWKLSPK
jgi:hypothetical protein